MFFKKPRGFLSRTLIAFVSAVLSCAFIALCLSPSQAAASEKLVRVIHIIPSDATDDEKHPERRRAYWSAVAAVQSQWSDAGLTFKLSPDIITLELDENCDFLTSANFRGEQLPGEPEGKTVVYRALELIETEAKQKGLEWSTDKVNVIFLPCFYGGISGNAFNGGIETAVRGIKSVFIYKTATSGILPPADQSEELAITNQRSGVEDGPAKALRSGIGTIGHELGHVLGNIPDQYNNNDWCKEGDVTHTAPMCRESWPDLAFGQVDKQAVLDVGCDWIIECGSDAEPDLIDYAYIRAPSLDKCIEITLVDQMLTPKWADCAEVKVQKFTARPRADGFQFKSKINDLCLGIGPRPLPHGSFRIQLTDCNGPLETTLHRSGDRFVFARSGTCFSARVAQGGAPNSVLTNDCDTVPETALRFSGLIPFYANKKVTLGKLDNVWILPNKGRVELRRGLSCAGIAGAAKHQGAKILWQDCSGDLAQQFDIDFIAHGFRLRSALSGMCVGANGGSKKSGQFAIQSDCSANPSNAFLLTSVGTKPSVYYWNDPVSRLDDGLFSGGYSMRFAHSDLCLDSASAVESVLIQTECRIPAVGFEGVTLGNDIKAHIVHLKSGKCLRLQVTASYDQMRPTLVPCETGNPSRFSTRSTREGAPSNGSFYLDVEPALPDGSFGSTFCLRDNRTSEDPKRPFSFGYICPRTNDVNVTHPLYEVSWFGEQLRFLSRAGDDWNPKCLTLKEGIASAGNSILLSECIADDTQQFRFTVVPG